MLDDAWLCVEIINTMLLRRKMKVTTLEQYQFDFDFPVVNYYGRLGFDFSKEPFDDIAREYIASYNAQFPKCSLRKGIAEIINELNRKGFSQSVLSASQQSFLIKCIEHYGLKNYFKNIGGLDDYCAYGKVDAGRKLLKNLSIKGEEILLIGDTTHDYEVACKLGADCVLLPAGHQSRERLIAAGAKVCDSLSQAFASLI